MTTATTTVADFILARVVEWEQVAHAVPDAEAKSAASVFTSLHSPTGTVEMQPARVLTQCAAYRAIVGLHGVDFVHDDDVVGGFAEVCGVCASLGMPEPYPCPTLRALASIWADHADYRSEWAS